MRYEHSLKSQENCTASVTDGPLAPLHTLYVVAILSFVPMDRGESEEKELLDVSGEAYVSPYCPSILTVS